MVDFFSRGYSRVCVFCVCVAGGGGGGGGPRAPPPRVGGGGGGVRGGLGPSTPLSSLGSGD